MPEPTNTPSAAPVRLRTLYMTCGACPSQWEGTAEDGRAIYVRYRHGYLSAGVGPTMDDAVTAGWNIEPPSPGVLIHSEQVTDEDDGVMGTAEMLERTGLAYADA